MYVDKSEKSNPFSVLRIIIFRRFVMRMCDYGF